MQKYNQMCVVFLFVFVFSRMVFYENKSRNPVFYWSLVEFCRVDWGLVLKSHGSIEVGLDDLGDLFQP